MPKGPAVLKAQSVTLCWEHITPCQRIASPAAAWFSLRLGPRKGKKKLNSFETARGGRMQFSPSIFHFFSQSLLFLNILLKIWIAELPGGVQYPMQHWDKDKSLTHASSLLLRIFILSTLLILDGATYMLQLLDPLWEL